MCSLDRKLSRVQRSGCLQCRARNRRLRHASTFCTPQAGVGAEVAGLFAGPADPAGPMGLEPELGFSRMPFYFFAMLFMIWLEIYLKICSFHQIQHLFNLFFYYMNLNKSKSLVFSFMLISSEVGGFMLSYGMEKCKQSVNWKLGQFLRGSLRGNFTYCCQKHGFKSMEIKTTNSTNWSCNPYKSI